MSEFIIDELIALGDKNFLSGDNMFCFGDRQTRKTQNMVLKSFISYFRKPSDEYRIIYVSATMNSGRPVLNRVKEIARFFKWEIIRDVKDGITLKIGCNRVIFDIVSTSDKLRGRHPTNFKIWDEPEYNQDKKEFFRSFALDLTLNKTFNFVIGGSSFYPMGLNPRLKDDMYG